MFKRIKWSIEYWELVEFSGGAFRHWLQIILSKDFEDNFVEDFEELKDK